MFCPKCGQEITAGYKFCPVCGENLENVTGGGGPKVNVNQQPEQSQSQSQQTYQQTQYQRPPATEDTGSIGWGILGFFIPIVGLILFLVWNSSKPRNAKSAGIGALASVIFSVIFYSIV